MTRRVLTADEFFIAGKLKTEWVPIPEWPSDNGDEAGVYVSQLDAVARSNWERSGLDENGNLVPGIEHHCKALAQAVVDETGNPIFTPEQIDKLKDQNGVIVARLLLVFVELNRITEEAIKHEKKN